MRSATILLAIGLLSAGIIAFELCLLQIFSYIQWYHFAYMVISIALLGFGAAGTFLTFVRNKLSGKFDSYFPLLIFVCAVSMPVCSDVSLMASVRFDSMLLFYDSTQVLRLLVTYLILSAPFFFGAAAIGLAFVELPEMIGRLYFANLLGSGVGAIASVGMMWLVFPNVQPTVIAVIVFAAGIVSMRIARRRWGGILYPAVCGAVIVYLMMHIPGFSPSEFKGIAKTLNLPESRINSERTSPYGLIQVVEAPTLRYAPGLSTKYSALVPRNDGVFINGDWLGSLYRTEGEAQPPDILNYMTSALPYAISKRNKVLIVDAGTGMEIQRAILNQAQEILATEPNAAVIELLKDAITDTRVKIQNTEARTLLASENRTYDLIVLPIIESFGGNAGLYALKEQYTLSVESFRGMLARLNMDGAVSVTTWIDYPMRNALKICATIIAALREEGKTDYTEYLAAIKSWGTITFVVKNSPLTAQERNRVREFCARYQFDPVLLPGVTSQERVKYNTVQDERFLEYFDNIVSDRVNFLSDYKFNIEPATDEKPYFSQFIKLGSIPELRETFGEQSTPYFELGYFIVFVTLGQILGAAAVLILLPLVKLMRNSSGKFRIFLYFAGIGLGYIFTEIVLIQRFILFFGNTVYAAAAVIGLMLISSGAGSYFSSSIVSRIGLRGVIGIVCSFLAAYSFGLMPVLRATIHLPDAAKIILSMVIIGLPSFFMGVPFPTGMKKVSGVNPDLVPWAWGVNGCFSVIGTAAATLLAAEFGFVWVMIIAALVYSMTGFSHLGWAR